MKFRIDGVEYAADDIGDLTQRDLLAMAKQAGMGVQTWARTLSQIQRLAWVDDRVVVLSEDEAKARPDDVDPDLFLDSEPHLRAFLILVWIARRTSGQPSLTFDESTSLPWSELEFVPDEDDDEPEPEPDPSLPSAGVPVDGDAAATPTGP